MYYIVTCINFTFSNREFESEVYLEVLLMSNKVMIRHRACISIATRPSKLLYSLGGGNKAKCSSVRCGQTDVTLLVATHTCQPDAQAQETLHTW